MSVKYHVSEILPPVYYFLPKLYNAPCSAVSLR